MDPNMMFVPPQAINESYESLPRKSPSGASSRRQSIVSSCNTRMSTRRFTNFWSIEQFTVQQELHSFGECLLAPKFGDDDYEFALKLFPSGKDEDTIGFLSLFLLINKCPNPRLRFRVSFTVETLDGPRNCALNKNLVTINRAGIVTASKFFSLDVLKSLSARYLPNDSLTIGVDLTVFGESFNTSNYESSGSEPCSKLARYDSDLYHIRQQNDGFVDLLRTGDLSDFTVIASCGREFAVHMAVLAGRSEYFRAMFRSEGTKETAEKRVTFNDVRGDVLEIILHHIYSPESTRDRLFDQDMSTELIMAADRFMIDSLRDDMAKLLLRKVDVSNVLSRIQFADLMQCASLFKKLMGFFVEHKQQCMNSQEWSDIRKNNPGLTARVLEEALTLVDEPCTSSMFAKQFERSQSQQMMYPNMVPMPNMGQNQ